jgi:hypothetical protein
MPEPEETQKVKSIICRIWSFSSQLPSGYEKRTVSGEI